VHFSVCQFHYQIVLLSRTVPYAVYEDFLKPRDKGEGFTSRLWSFIQGGPIAFLDRALSLHVPGEDVQSLTFWKYCLENLLLDKKLHQRFLCGSIGSMMITPFDLFPHSSKIIISAYCFSSRDS